MAYLPQQLSLTAVAVGACNVEASDALSGVPSWETVQSRLAPGVGATDVPISDTGLEMGTQPANVDRTTRWSLVKVRPESCQPVNIRHCSIINCVAPIRICDNGGWTDTWFAGHGVIFNIGVYPYAEVQIQVFPQGALEERIVINAENYGERYAVIPEKHWDKHPLLEAAIEYMRVPKDLAFEVTIYSEAPSGASTGTSAAVTVALIGALDCLTPGRLTAARGRPGSAAHRDRNARPAVRHPGSALLGVRRHQLHRDVTSIRTPRSRRSRCPMPPGGSWSGGWR